jgi:hypothetical protein
LHVWIHAIQRTTLPPLPTPPKQAETEVMIATEAYKAARAQLEQAWARRKAARMAETRSKRAGRMQRTTP